MTHMKRFLAVYDEVQGFLLDGMTKSFEMDANRTRYLKDMMDTTCLGGKYNRGLCVVDVADSLAKYKRLDDARREEALHDACICGWMVEMLQAHFLVEDDIMDSSTIRRGKPCWYLHPGVTMQVAINDGLILMSWAMRMAQHYFEGRSFLAEVLRVFQDVHMKTTIGQLYDVTSMVDSNKLDAHVAHSTTTDYVEYTLFNYKRIVKYKTAFYTYWLPLMMGLLVTDCVDCVDVAIMEDVAMLMGEYFQVQDDVMDCFTPSEVLGKAGTDIQDAKCSWLAVTFLAIATPEQVAIFKANYGRPEPDHVAAIKQLYEDTNLQSQFKDYEAEVVAKVETCIKKLSESNTAFAAGVQTLWDKTYKRSK